MSFLKLGRARGVHAQKRAKPEARGGEFFHFTFFIFTCKSDALCREKESEKNSPAERERFGK